MIVYLDTSAVVKLVVEEPGSDLAARLWDAADVRITSLVTYAEARAALAAARRDRRTTAGASAAAAVQLEARWSECTKVGVSEPLVHDAGNLADAERLRGYDAVHLASALRADARDLIVATWDTALGDAATRMGLTVAPAAVPVRPHLREGHP